MSQNLIFASLLGLNIKALGQGMFLAYAGCTAIGLLFSIIFLIGLKQPLAKIFFMAMTIILSVELFNVLQLI